MTTRNLGERRREHVGSCSARNVIDNDGDRDRSSHGGKMVNQFAKSKSCDEFQDMSIEFAKYVDILTPRINSVIDDLHRNKIKCGIAMFGETVFTIVSDKMEKIVLDIFKKYDDGVIIKSKIDNVGARLT